MSDTKISDPPKRIYADRGPRGGWMYREERLRDTVAEYALVDPDRASPPPSGEAGEVTDLADLQLLMHLKDDNVWDGARPVVESNFEQCFRLSEAGLIALEQVARGVRLHITRLGMKAISRALPTKSGPRAAPNLFNPRGQRQ
jgi:hypothetical protein